MGGPLTVVDLFSGAGGFTLGFERAGFDPELAVDHDRHSVATYNANFGGVGVLADLRDSPLKGVDADVVLGAPPCQPYSQLGGGGDEDPRRGLSGKFMDAVEAIGPRAFVVENVARYLDSPEAKLVGRRGSQLGYEVTHRVLDAAQHGVPQHRHRAFLIGSREGTPFFPAQQEETFDVRAAMGDLPPEPDEENWHISRSYHEISRKRMRHVPPGGNRFDLPENLLPPCWKGHESASTDVYGRLWWDEPSVTLRSEFIKPEKGRYLHPEENRAITPREGARLQSFPDSYDFCGHMTSVVRQIGNAVPPRLAYRLAESVRAHLEDGIQGTVDDAGSSPDFRRPTVPRELPERYDTDCLLPQTLAAGQVASTRAQA